MNFVCEKLNPSEECQLTERNREQRNDGRKIKSIYMISFEYLLSPISSNDFSSGIEANTIRRYTPNRNLLRRKNTLANKNKKLDGAKAKKKLITPTLCTSRTVLDHSMIVLYFIRTTLGLVMKVFKFFRMTSVPSTVTTKHSGATCMLYPKEIEKKTSYRFFSLLDI